MTKFLVIRHGQSEVTDRLSGRAPDIHLNREGRKQAEDLSIMIEKYPLDYIISSPIQRTIETAEIIAARFNKAVIIDDSFIEIDFGEWTGLTWKELDQLKAWNYFNNFRSNTRIPGGELFTEVQSRMINGVKKLAYEYPGKTIAIVSHGDPIKALFMYFLGIPPDFILRFTISNASLSILEINNSSVQIEGINIVSYPR